MNLIAIANITFTLITFLAIGHLINTKAPWLRELLEVITDEA